MYFTFINLLSDVTLKINCANNIHNLKDIRIKYFAKKGFLPLHFKHIIGNLNYKEIFFIREAFYKTKKFITHKLKNHKFFFNKETISTNTFDVTLPGRVGEHLGHIHPITHTLNRIKKIFINIGYIAVNGPEIEDEFHNFQALNMSFNHPARAMHDTFYFNNNTNSNNNYMLRSHTSSMLIRTLEVTNPPLKVLSYGKVYRCDSDLSHSPMFHQVEGLFVDEFVTFSDLKSTIELFLKIFFEGQKIELRFRPSYFPFTEPSAEIDVRINTFSTWLEVMGCGMILSNILQMFNINSIYTGFAFGIGVERLTMLRYGINDLRSLFYNDVRLLRQIKLF